jgi:hypothetical protein
MIYSMNGKIMLEDQLNTTSETSSLNVGQLSAGCYILELKTEAAVWRTKLLIL